MSSRACRGPHSLALAALLLLQACAGTQMGTGPRRGPPADSLMGATAGALTALFGKPSLIQRDQGVEVWQYAGNRCTLLFYLYEPEGGGTAKTAFIDARDKYAGTTPTQTCMSDVFARHLAAK